MMAVWCVLQVNEVLDDQAMLRKYKKEIDQLKKKLRYTSAGGEKDMEICQMINQMQSLQVAASPTHANTRARSTCMSHARTRHAACSMPG